MKQLRALLHQRQNTDILRQAESIIV